MNAINSQEDDFIPEFPPETTGFIVDEYANNYSLTAEDAAKNQEIKKHKSHYQKSFQRYRAFSNHSSANDQPRTFTSW